MVVLRIGEMCGGGIKSSCTRLLYLVVNNGIFVRVRAFMHLPSCVNFHASFYPYCYK